MQRKSPFPGFPFGGYTPGSPMTPPQGPFFPGPTPPPVPPPGPTPFPPTSQYPFGPGGPGGPGPGGPGGPSPGGAQQPPSSPPPSYEPSFAQATKTGGQTAGPGALKISPGSILPCMYRYVKLWLYNGRSFWAYLTYVDFRSVAGYRWTGFRWVYFGIDTRRISAFYCA